MKKLIWISDMHLGLRTDDIDRTEEIESVCMYAFKHAVKIKAKWIVLGGDIFDKNNPTEELIAVLLRLLEFARKHDIIVFVMDGNHEKFHRSNRQSCLQFLENLKGVFPNVRWISDVKTVRVNKDKRHRTYFTFLPHVNKVHIPKEYDTPQQYVDARADEIIKKMTFFGQHFVFSHLNVRGAVPGSEEDMLKKSEIFLPDHFHTRNYLDKPIPIVLNGHIHSRQKNGLASIIGSPIYVSFGEKERNKYFAVVDVADKDGEVSRIRLKKSPCRKFLELNVTVEGKDGDVEGVIAEFTDQLTGNEYVKVNATVHEGAGYVNWEEVRKTIQKRAFHVKPIVPRQLRKRVKRNSRQTIKLAPTDAVKVFVKSNKPKNRKTVLECANEYIERVL